MTRNKDCKTQKVPNVHIHGVPYRTIDTFSHCNFVIFAYFFL